MNSIDGKELGRIDMVHIESVVEGLRERFYGPFLVD